MPKRFTATNKWEDPWFFSLESSDKLFWIYLLDKCDHAGIWQVNWPLAEFHIKNKVNAKAFGGRIIQLTEERWFIPKFIEFQYGQLNPSNNTHRSVITLLEKAGAYKFLKTPLPGEEPLPYQIPSIDNKRSQTGAGQPLPSPCPGVLDMDKDVEKDTDINKRHKRNVTSVTLPKWIDSPTWNSYLEMRIKTRKPMTITAQELAVKKLAELQILGHNPNKVLEQSIFNSWQGLFPIKETTIKTSGATPIPGKYDSISSKAGGNNA